MHAIGLVLRLYSCTDSQARLQLFMHAAFDAVVSKLSVLHAYCSIKQGLPENFSPICDLSYFKLLSLASGVIVPVQCVWQLAMGLAHL